MISRFFAKTKPINYLVLFVCFFVFFLAHFLVTNYGQLDLKVFFEALLLLVGLFLQGVVMDRIVVKTRVTQQSTFALLVYLILFIAFLDVIIDQKVVWANFFILLGIYELLCIDNTKILNLEIFNAALWLCTASFFVPMALFFLPMVYVAIFMFSTKVFKNWLMPLVAILTYVLIAMAYTSMMGASAAWLSGYTIERSWFSLEGFEAANYTRLILYVLTIIAIFSLIFLRSSISGGFKISKLRFLLTVFCLGVFIMLMSVGNEYGLELIFFTFCPAAVLSTNYFELFDLKKFKEPILIIGILIPITFAITILLGF